jgi:hypothetical protein
MYGEQVCGKDYTFSDEEVGLFNKGEPSSLVVLLLPKGLAIPVQAGPEQGAVDLWSSMDVCCAQVWVVV